MEKIMNCIDFNKDWVISDGSTVELPHCYPDRRPECYSKTFGRPDSQCVYLHLPAASMICDIELNGEKTAHHEGGFSSIYADLSGKLKDINVLKIYTENTANDRVYPQKADFTFYGGLYRGARLILCGSDHFCFDKWGGCGLKISQDIDLSEKTARITFESWQTGGDEVIFEAAGQRIKAASLEGHAHAEMLISDVHLWDGINDPYLYECRAELYSEGQLQDEACTRFGCRSFRVDAKEGFFLNGRSYPLRGVSRHQDREGMGNAISLSQHREDIGLICELGVNTIRLAHYQHAQEFYDLCDERGLIVWAEIPYITEHMPHGRQNTLDQMRELVTQCVNHPSIVCWGLSNEISAGGEVNEDVLENHRLLNDLCHELDPGRLTVLANAFMLEHESPILEIADMNSYNLYFGWYLGTLQQNDSFLDEYHEKYPDRVIGFSEYGADANPVLHSNMPERGDYSEEYQCAYHEHMIGMINARPWLWATHVWNMFDFGAAGRKEGGKEDLNQKGLVSWDRKVKKDAFFLYKAQWSSEPFIHICGSRYVERDEEVTEIKIYTNQKAVDLFVDGNLYASDEGSKIFCFKVPISKEHVIEARTGELSDRISIRKVDAPPKEYYLKAKRPVINWFDKLDDSCYSVKDLIGDIRKHPEAERVYSEFRSKMSKRGGGAAESAHKNKNLQKMLDGMPFESILRQGNVSDDIVRSLNSALQKIKKI